MSLFQPSIKDAFGTYLDIAHGAGKMIHDQTRIKIHFSYVVGILIACLIASIAVPWSNIDNLPELISFAVGFASLILAVIAIVQNITVGPNLTSALNELGATADGISQATRLLDESSRKFEQKLDIFSNLPDQLRDTEGRLAASIETMRDQQIAKIQLTTESSSGVVKENSELQIDDLTIGATAALYIAKMSSERENFIKLSEVLKGATVQEWTEGYTNANLWWMNNANIIEAEFATGGEIRVTKLVKFSAKQIVARANEIKSASFKEDRKLIDRFFMEEANNGSAEEA